jgi:hypothetical protein
MLLRTSKATAVVGDVTARGRASTQDVLERRGQARDVTPAPSHWAADELSLGCRSELSSRRFPNALWVRVAKVIPAYGSHSSWRWHLLARMYLTSPRAKAVGCTPPPPKKRQTASHLRVGSYDGSLASADSVSCIRFQNGTKTNLSMNHQQ